MAAPPNQEGVQAGLQPPRLADGSVVTGATKERHRVENKRHRTQAQETAMPVPYWTTHRGDFKVPAAREGPTEYRGEMCPQGLALHHPAAGTLLEYATRGCPVNAGRPWTREEMEAAIQRGPHASAIEPDAMQQLHEEVQEKVKKGQVQVVTWDSIKDNPPRELKVSPMAMIPHKSRKYRAILDLSFECRLSDAKTIKSVNATSTKTAPKGAIDQMGHSLMRIVYAFAEADRENPDVKIFSAKWYVQDRFRRLVAEDGEEWNFAYVLPQEEGEPTKLVIPTSLQMGWIESPPYFCAASETDGCSPAAD